LAFAERHEAKATMLLSPKLNAANTGLVFAIIFVASALNSGGTVYADAPATKALGQLTLGEKSTALLGGRLCVKVPATAKVEARGHNIMAAREADDDETRIVVDAGEQRLVLMTYELYALTGGDLDKAARADVAAKWGKEAGTLKLEKFAVAAPLTAVAVIRPQPEGKREANLVLALYVGSEDGTVQYLAFYVNPAAIKDVAGATSLAKRIAASVTAGSRKLSSKAGSRRFPGVDGDQLVIMVPEGFVASTQEGPDFAVYHLYKLVVLGKPASACSIYLGGHPSYQYEQAEKRPEKVTPLKGKLFWQEVAWQNWSQAGRTTTEVIVPHPKGKGMTVHVFCSASSQNEAAALRTMAETLRVDEPKN
jgi:hypothetical protein